VVRVPTQFPNSTIVCLGTGPSLTQADVDACQGRVPVIAVNDAYRLAPWADVLYAADAKWWVAHHGVPGFTGQKYSIANLRKLSPPHPDGVAVLRNATQEGLCLDPTGLCAGIHGGHNSGFQALNLAVHFGAKCVIFLGYDMQPSADGRTHFFGDHPAPLDKQSPYKLFASSFDAVAAQLVSLGIAVLNASRQTALTCFPRLALADALKAVTA
jgi:hypothetical protein